MDNLDLSLENGYNCDHAWNRTWSSELKASLNYHHRKVKIRSENRFNQISANSGLGYTNLNP